MTSRTAFQSPSIDCPQEDGARSGGWEFSRKHDAFLVPSSSYLTVGCQTVRGHLRYSAGSSRMLTILQLTPVSVLEFAQLAHETGSMSSLNERGA